jgi:Flp pilus assembly pilin Flp
MAVEERRSLAAEYALVIATLLTVLVVAGMAALTAHHVLGASCETLAKSSSRSMPVSCR